MARIGVYGGSFNPVHRGHVLAAEEFVRLMELDRLLVIPAGIPPHKLLAPNSPDGDARLRMLRAAMAQVPGAEVVDLEIRREGKSYSVDTIAEIRQSCPGDELFLLVGTDMLLSFETWHRFEDLLRMVTLTVFRRGDLSPTEDRRVRDEVERLCGEFGAAVETPVNAYLNLSSSEVRRMLFFGCGEEMIPPEVMTIIQGEGLYGVGGDYRNLTLDKLTEVSLSLHKAKRVPHAVGCSQTAADLARRHGADPDAAARAGILHDVTKALSSAHQLRLCEKYGIMTSEYSGDQVKLLHAVTAAEVARSVFGEREEICQAIRWHTTGRAGMSLLEKIIYIADYIEPNRDFPGVERLRELAYSDLDEAVILGIDMTIRNLEERGRTLNRDSLQARDFLIQERKQV